MFIKPCVPIRRVAVCPECEVPVTFDDVISAAATLGGVANRTPVHTSQTLDKMTGAAVFLKCENFQKTGAFKFRGAYNALSRLSAEQKKSGVLTFSSGNHAQALAHAGQILGVEVTIVMPIDAPAFERGGRTNRSLTHCRPPKMTKEPHALTENYQTGSEITQRFTKKSIECRVLSIRCRNVQPLHVRQCFLCVALCDLRVSVVKNGVVGLRCD